MGILDRGGSYPKLQSGGLGGVMEIGTKCLTLKDTRTLVALWALGMNNERLVDNQTGAEKRKGPLEPRMERFQEARVAVGGGPVSSAGKRTLGWGLGGG